MTRHNKGIPDDSLQLGGKYPLVITMNRDDRKELILGQFLELYRDLFGSGNDEDRLSDIIIRASSQKNGTILAIMENAREEAVRLQSAGFRVSIRDQNTMFRGRHSGPERDHLQYRRHTGRQDAAQTE